MIVSFPGFFRFPACPARAARPMFSPRKQVCRTTKPAVRFNVRLFRGFRRILHQNVRENTKYGQENPTEVRIRLIRPKSLDNMGHICYNNQAVSEELTAAILENDTERDRKYKKQSDFEE